MPAVALAWGPWSASAGMTSRLTENDRARMARGGLRPLPADTGLALLDAALESGEPALMPMLLDTAVIARAESVPPLFREVAAKGRPAAAGSGQPGRPDIRGELSRLAGADAERMLQDEVCAQAALVLGHAAGTDIDVGSPFTDLGFDSLTAVELRNRLGALTGIRLPATLVFDYPTVTDLAGYLMAEVGLGAPDQASVMAGSSELAGIAGAAGDDTGLADADAEELFDLIDKGFDA
jgi:acyl carrier protein